MDKAPSRTLWIDYLRSFITVLVVAHHSSLAYTTFASFDKVAYIRSTNPIVDDKRWVGLDIFENFNDVFFMSLMFFIAGLFVVKSVEKKGLSAFVRDRFYRLFLPFLLGGTVLNLIAHYPSYLVAHGTAPVREYVIDFFKVEQWPVGPPWFIWVLFVFNVLLACLYLIRKSIAGPSKSFGIQFSGKSFPLISVWFLLTLALYVPFAFWLGTGAWTGFGPFDFQVNRAPLYFGYFVFGALIGNTNFNDTLFSTTSPLVRNWRLWAILCVLIYTLLTICSGPLTNLVKTGSLTKFNGYLIYFTIYTASCTFSCIAFLTIFRGVIKTSRKWWDSLSEHAYLIYLLHYPFVIWAQYLLLNIPLPAFGKFLLTFLVAFPGSWAVGVLLRKIGIIKKYV